MEDDGGFQSGGGGGDTGGFDQGNTTAPQVIEGDNKWGNDAGAAGDDGWSAAAPAAPIESGGW